MNKQHACALFSFASMATVSLIFGTPVQAHPVSHTNKTPQANSLPALAGSATVGQSTRYATTSHPSTIPLIAGIGDDMAPASNPTGDTSGGQSFNKTMNVGESEILEFNHITTTAVGDPGVVDIALLSSGRLLINAKGTGHTTVFVYDRHGKNIVSVTVLPSENVGVLAAKIEEEIGIPTVTVRAINDWIFLEGSAPTQAAASMAQAIAEAYTPKVKNMVVTGDIIHRLSMAEQYARLLNENLSTQGITAVAFDEKTLVLTGKYAIPIGAAAVTPDVGVMEAAAQTTAQVDPLKQLLASLPAELKVVNLINFEREKAKQVLVRAKIVDIDRNSQKSLGLDWGALNITQQQVGTTQSTQQVATFQSQPILFGQLDPFHNGNLNSFPGGGALSRVLPWAAQLSALVREGKARVLSEPSLLVLDGNSANMMVGGEFAIPVLQGASGGAVTVQFKPFGVKLSIAPTVIAGDTIQLTVSPEVSTLDFSAGVTFAGTVVPGLATRKATSTLQMRDGQTLVIGGLYSSDYAKNVSRVPVLSSIPVLGEFFKNTTTTKTEHELLVMLEAEVITPDSIGATPPPADSLENMNIHKPYVPRKEFDQDFPDIENGPFHHDPEAPKAPVVMPGTDRK